MLKAAKITERQTAGKGLRPYLNGAGFQLTEKKDRLGFATKKNTKEGKLTSIQGRNQKMGRK